MATELERQRLRMDLGFNATDEASLTNDTIDAIFLEAGEYWLDPLAATAGTRILSIRRLLMQAANEVDYTANKTSEKASQRYKHLSAELDRWQKIQDDVLIASGEIGTVRSGKPMQQPPRVREYPWGYTW
jgi:hypothetical protein